MDTDQNGTITIDELRRGLREQGSTVSEEELDTLVRPAADPVHSVAAYVVEIIMQAGLLTCLPLGAQVRQLDADNSGKELAFICLIPVEGSPMVTHT